MEVENLTAILKDIEQKEEIFLEDLRSLDYEGSTLEQRALEHKKSMDNLRSEAIVRQNKNIGVTEKDLETYAENTEQLSLSIEKDSEMLEVLKTLKEPLEFYTALRNDPLFEKYIPLVICANDYVKKELLAFDNEHNLKHFRVSTANMYRNKLTNISIYAVNYKYKLPEEFSFLNLFEKEITVNMDIIESRYPERNLQDYEAYIKKIDVSLRSIEAFTKKRDSFSFFKLVVGKTKRERLKDYYNKAIDNSKSAIYQSYSSLLTFKEAMDNSVINANIEKQEKEQLEMKDELLIIQKFLKEQLLFNMTLNGPYSKK